MTRSITHFIHKYRLLIDIYWIGVNELWANMLEVNKPHDIISLIPEKLLIALDLVELSLLIKTTLIQLFHLSWIWLSRRRNHVVSVRVALQVHPVSPQCEPEERGELCAVPPSAACVWTVPFSGRDSVPQPVTPRRDRVRRPLPPPRSGLVSTRSDTITSWSS